MDEKKTVTIQRVEEPQERTEPERQFGGPQSGLPPRFVVGSDLAPYLIVGLDFGANYLRASTFANGSPHLLSPGRFRALVEDAMSIETTDTQLVHSLKHCVAGDYVIKNGDQTYSAVEVTRRYLSGIKNRIEQSTERLLAKAVIAVPAGFTHRQRDTLIRASNDAEIAVLGLINEPTAAALDACYTFNLANGKYLVVSVGAYTFEVSMIHVQNKLIEVKVTRGAQGLSGHAITLALVEGFQSEFEHSPIEQIHVALERAKPDIDNKGRAQVTLGGQQLTIDKTMASTILNPQRIAMEQLIESVMTDSHTKDSEIVSLILTGEGTKLYLLQNILDARFPQLAKTGSNVSSGAAIYAALLVRQAKDWVVWDAVSNPIMVAQGDRVREVISAGSPVPINGHAALVPNEEGKTTATIMQRATDANDDIVHVATVTVSEEMPPGSSVDLSVMATGDGTLSFSARHKSLDVNLTLEVTRPEEGNPVVDLTPVAPSPKIDEHSCEPGLTVERYGHRWLVESIVESSPAERAGINVYDEVLSIDDTTSVKLRNAVPYHLAGPRGDIKKLVLLNGSTIYRAEVACEVECNRWELPKLQAAIAEATINDDSNKLVRALLDHAHYSIAMAEPKDYEAARNAITRALGFASSKSDVSSTLHLRAQCAYCRLHIALAASDKENYQKHISVAYSSCRAIIAFLVESPPMPAAAAKLLCDLAEQWMSVSDLTDARPEAKRLVQQALKILPATGLPAAVLARFQALNPLFGKSDPTSVSSDTTETKESIEASYGERLIHLLAIHIGLDQIGQLVDEFANEIERGDLPDPQLINDFPFQTALSYKAHGDWWLAYEVSGRAPDEVESALMRQDCRGRILYCQSSKKAYELAGAILLRIMKEAEEKEDRSKHALYLSALANVLASMGNDLACERAVNTVRRFIELGAHLIHTNIEDISKTYLAAGAYDSALDFCSHQLKRLDTHNESQRLEAAQALCGLARVLSALREDFSQCKEIYEQLLQLFADEKRMLLHYTVRYAEFLIRAQDTQAAKVIQDAEQLAKSLGVITDETAVAWCDQLRNRRGARTFV